MDGADKTKDELLREVARLRGELAQARAVASGSARDLPSQERIELRRQELRLRLIVDGVRDHAISMLDPEGRILTFNAAAERIKGYSLSEVQGQHFRLFFTAEDRAAKLPEEELRVALEHGRYEGEGFRLRKDGSRFYAAVSLSPLHDSDGTLVGFVKVTQDRTRYRELSEALQRREDQLRLILDGVRDHAISMLDPEGRVLTLNASAERIKGYRLDEVRGQNFRIFFTPEDRADGLPERELEVARTEGRFTSEGFRQRKDGSRFYAMVSVSPLRGGDGELIGFVKVTQDITEQRRLAEEARLAREQAEREREALQEANEKLRIVLEDVDDGITLQDATGALVYANELAAKMLGFDSIADLLATPSAEIAGRFVLLDDAGRTLPVERSPSYRAFRGERVSNELLRFRPTDTPQERWSIASATPLLDAAGSLRYVVNTFKDVTAQRHAEGAIRFLADASTALASSLDYQQTLATVASLCVPRIADWAAVDMLGPNQTLQRLAVVHTDPMKVALAHDVWQKRPPRLDDEQGLGRVIRTGTPAVMWEITDDILAASLEDPELLAIYRKLGLKSSITVPLMLRGKAIGGITLVTEGMRRFCDRDLMLAQELALRASVAIENATLYREARDASQLKDEFLATVSHELRTPLTAVLGWATLVRSRPNDPAYVSRGLDTIERNARAQVQLIQDLLDISRVITGKLRLDVEPVDVSSVVKTAVDTVAPAFRAKGIILTPVLDPSAEPVMGDPDRLLQVVNNLLTNAVKFTPKGGHVRVYLRKVDSSVELIVRDTGVGIAPDFLPHVFERFRQADGGITRSRGGLGLGLAISRSLIELHGGAIAAESAGEGQGATFTVRLPMAGLKSQPQADSSSEPHGAAEEMTCPPELEGLRVLVVDDEPDTRALLQIVLETCKVHVVTAASAAEALEQLRESRFDMLISDIGMPGEDGYALIRQVRALPSEQGGRTPAIALTAYASTRDRTRALVAGYSLHLPKPVDPAELVVTVANLLGRFSRT